LSKLTEAKGNISLAHMGQMQCTPEDAALRPDLILIRSYVTYKGFPSDYVNNYDISMIVNNIKVGGVMRSTSGKSFPTCEVKLCFGEAMGKK